MGDLSLPHGFVYLPSDDPFCHVYAQLHVVTLTIVSGILHAGFSNNFESIVVRFSNCRRPSTPAAAPVVFNKQHTGVRSRAKGVSVLDVVVETMLDPIHGITDGHTAHVYSTHYQMGEPLMIIEKT